MKAKLSFKTGEQETIENVIAVHYDIMGCLIIDYVVDNDIKWYVVSPDKQISVEISTK